MTLLLYGIVHADNARLDAVRRQEPDLVVIEHENVAMVVSSEPDRSQLDSAIPVDRDVLRLSGHAGHSGAIGSGSAPGVRDGVHLHHLGPLPIIHFLDVVADLGRIRMDGQRRQAGGHRPRAPRV